MLWSLGHHHEDGQDVELIGGEVVVEEVPGLAVSQPELVPGSITSSDMDCRGRAEYQWCSNALVKD